MTMSWKNLLDLGWLILLLALFYYFWRTRHNIIKTHSWRKTNGYVTICEWSMHQHLLWPQIEFKYEVDGQAFTSQQMFIDAVFINLHSAYAREMAYKVAMAHKENEAINVYYNPDDPSLAVLDTAVPAKLNVVLGLIGVLLTLHCALLGSRFFSFF